MKFRVGGLSQHKDPTQMFLRRSGKMSGKILISSRLWDKVKLGMNRQGVVDKVQVMSEASRG